MTKLSPARTRAATTFHGDIAPGSPEEAYQAINRAKMLWNFRRRDIDSWQEVITKWAGEPKAWHRTPEGAPYGTAKAMIEAEIGANYTVFMAFIQLIVGPDYAALLVDDQVGGDSLLIPVNPVLAANSLAGWGDREWIATFLDAFLEATEETATPMEGVSDA